MSTNTTDKERKVTTSRLIEMKRRGEKIAMLTAYDFSMAQLIDQAGIDVILVGDSASNVMAGNMTTLPITLDQMIYHAKSVIKGTNRALVVCDMPFGTYQGNPMEAGLCHQDYEREPCRGREDGRRQRNPQSLSSAYFRPVYP